MPTILGQIIPILLTPNKMKEIPKDALVVLPTESKALILRVLVAGHCIFRLWYKYADIWWPIGGWDEPLFEAKEEILEGRNERVYTIHSDARNFCLQLEEGDVKSVIFASIRSVIPGEIV